MGILQSLSDAISWLREPLASAWAAAEPILCVLYLAAVLIISLWIWRQQGKGTRLLSTALFVLLAGEAYRLVPRIVEAISPRAPLPDGDGIGRIVSYLATAGFFLFLEFYREQRYGKAETVAGRRMESAVFILFGLIAAEGLVRFNRWIGGNGEYFWLIIRGLLLTAMGMLTGQSSMQ